MRVALNVFMKRMNATALAAAVPADSGNYDNGNEDGPLIRTQSNVKHEINDEEAARGK
jgi:hypothetical protein